MRRLAPVGAAVVVAAALVVAGCGGGGDSSADATPVAGTAPVAAAAPVAVASVSPGSPVTAGPKTPKDVAAALKGSKVVVIAFLVKGTADDDDVAAALKTVQGDRLSRNSAKFFIYNVGSDKFGDLADLLGANGTPSVAVIGRDRILTNMWSGLVDAPILRQSILDAADTAAAHPGAS